MSTLDERYDDAMFDFSRGDLDGAIGRLCSILDEDPDYFDARLSLGMAYCRKGDFMRAIEEGHKARVLRPDEQLVHTNLSIYYMKAGNKPQAEHHALQARIASWKTNPQPADLSQSEADPDLNLHQPRPENIRLPSRFPEMPWKRKPIQSGGEDPTDASKP